MIALIRSAAVLLRARPRARQMLRRVSKSVASSWSRVALSASVAAMKSSGVVFRGLSKGGLLALDVCLYLLDHHEEVMDELLIRVVWAGVRRVVVAEVKFDTVKPTFDEKGRGFVGNDG